MKVLTERGYTYGQHWAPYDIRVRELGTGKSRLETAKNHGLNFEIVPDIGLDEGIHAVRLLLPRCWFDEEKCRVGLEALTFYRKVYNERLQEFTDRPQHSWTSHGSDAFRMLAVRHKPPRKKRARQQAGASPTNKKDVVGASSAPTTSSRVGYLSDPLHTRQQRQMTRTVAELLHLHSKLVQEA